MGRYILCFNENNAKKNYTYFSNNYPNSPVKVIGFFGLRREYYFTGPPDEKVYWAWAVGYDFERKDVRDAHVFDCKYEDVTNRFRRQS